MGLIRPKRIRLEPSITLACLRETVSFRYFFFLGLISPRTPRSGRAVQQRSELKDV